MAITYGASSQPAQSTFNYDALVATSVANYRKTLIDQIGKLNLFFKKIMDNGQYESADGGLYLAEDLMYDLAPTDSYDGMDVLPLTPTEGITQAQFGWAQAATPIAISEKERKQNKHRIVNLVAAKIQQAELSIKEFWGKAFLHGGMLNGSGALTAPYVSLANGSTFINPLFRLVSSTPTTSLEIGGINQSSSVWWRNFAAESAATTGLGLLQEIMTQYNNCSRGTGGSPDLMWTDQTTWELISVAYYSKFRTEMQQVTSYPWPTLKWWNCEIVWDEFMPNVYAGTTDTSTANGGTLAFINSKFMKIRYESETNFVSGELEKPINQDAKFKHILWMGQTTINRRNKHSVLSKIPRSLTFS
jgi:hypothetical protein